MDKPPGALFSPTPLGHHSNPREGESTPTPVPPVWHVFPTGGTQSVAPDFRDVPAQDGEEATDVGFLGDGGTDGGGGILGVWDTAYSVLFVPVPGTQVVVLQQRLAGGETEPPEGAGKMDTAGEDIGKGGSG